MSYAKLNKGRLEYAPDNYTTEDGQIIVNFNKNKNIMSQYGYKELIDIRPAYDENTHFIVVESYTEYTDTIVVNYIIVEREATVPEPSIEERVSNIESQLNNMSIIFNDEVNK